MKFVIIMEFVTNDEELDAIDQRYLVDLKNRALVCNKILFSALYSSTSSNIDDKLSNMSNDNRMIQVDIELNITNLSWSNVGNTNVQCSKSSIQRNCVLLCGN